MNLRRQLAIRRQPDLGVVPFLGLGFMGFMEVYRGVYRGLRGFKPSIPELYMLGEPPHPVIVTIRDIPIIPLLQGGGSS